MKHRESVSTVVVNQPRAKRKFSTLQQRLLNARQGLTRFLKSKIVRICLIVLSFCGISIWTDNTAQITWKYVVKNLFSNAESIAVGSAAVVFFLEIPDRKKRDHYEAWQVINSGLNKAGD